VLPPRLAPIQVVVVPIYKNDEDFEKVDSYISPVISELRKLGVSVKYDSSDNNKPGWKFAEYELKGVPVRIAVGSRDVDNQTVEIARRDTLEKKQIEYAGLSSYIVQLLDDIQENIYNNALKFREQNTFKVDSWDEFKVTIEKGGFLLAHWDGTPETEQKIKDETKATIRVIPFGEKTEEGKCVYSGKPSAQRVVFARAY
jgi:prolyl-tRNA synthetase